MSFDPSTVGREVLDPALKIGGELFTGFLTSNVGRSQKVVTILREFRIF